MPCGGVPGQEGPLVSTHRVRSAQTARAPTSRRLTPARRRRRPAARQRGGGLPPPRGGSEARPRRQKSHHPTPRRQEDEIEVEKGYETASGGACEEMPRLGRGPNHGGPAPLWPHDVIVWIRTSAQGSVRDAGFLRGARRERGEADPKTIGVSSLRPQTQRSVMSGEHYDVDGYHEPTKLTTMTDEAHSDGLRQQTTTHHAAIDRMVRATRSVGGRIEIP